MSSGLLAGEGRRGPTSVTYQSGLPGLRRDPGRPGHGGGDPACDLTGSSHVLRRQPPPAGPTSRHASTRPRHSWPQQPSPTSIWVFRYCNPDPDGTLTKWYWIGGPGPTPETLARQAYGALAAPGFTIGTSPPGRSVVGIPTWFWAATAERR